MLTQKLHHASNGRPHPFILPIPANKSPSTMRFARGSYAYEFLKQATAEVKSEYKAYVAEPAELKHSFDAIPLGHKSAEDYGLSLLSEAGRLKEQLASTKALWHAHVDAKFGPSTAAKIQIDPMQDKHIVAQYEVAPGAPAARFKSVDEARKAQEKETFQSVRRKNAYVAAPIFSKYSRSNATEKTTADGIRRDAEHAARWDRVSEIIKQQGGAIVKDAIAVGDSTKNMEANYQACMTIPSAEMTVDMAKAIVSEDLATLKGISDPQARTEALLTIHANRRNQPLYATEMGLQSPAITLEATTAHKASAAQRNAMITPSNQAANDPAAKTATGRWKSAGSQKIAVTQPAPIPKSRPLPAKLKEKKEVALPKPKKPAAEENPYAKGRAQESKKRKVGKVLIHMAFGLSGGLAVNKLYNVITKRKPPAANEKQAEKKDVSKSPEQKIPANKSRSMRH